MNILKTFRMKLSRWQPDEDALTEQPPVDKFQNGELTPIEEDERDRQPVSEEISLEEKLRLNADIIVQTLSRHAGFELGFNE